MGARHVILDIPTNFAWKYFSFVKIRTITTMRNFVVIFDKISSDNVSAEITISYQT